jgi:hypothetical protein
MAVDARLDGEGAKLVGLRPDGRMGISWTWIGPRPYRSAAETNRGPGAVDAGPRLLTSANPGGPCRPCPTARP